MIGGGYFQFREYPLFVSPDFFGKWKVPGSQLHEEGWHHETIVPDRIFFIRSGTFLYHRKDIASDTLLLLFWERKGKEK